MTVEVISRATGQTRVIVIGGSFDKDSGLLPNARKSKRQAVQPVVSQPIFSSQEKEPVGRGRMHYDEERWFLKDYFRRYGKPPARKPRWKKRRHFPLTVNLRWMVKMTA